MGEAEIISLLIHGGPYATTALLFWLFLRERAERMANGALIVTLTKDMVTATLQMAKATEELSDQVKLIGDRRL